MAELYQCKNCEKSFDPSFDYCPHCGQETANILTVGVLFSNTIRNYFSIDARFFKSFIPLMIKPGVLARRFVDGKRMAYLHPAQFYLFISIVFFFIFSFTIRKADMEISKTLGKEFNKEVHSDLSTVPIDTLWVAPIDSASVVWQETLPSSFILRKEALDSLILSGAPQAEKLKAMGKAEDDGIIISKVYLQLLKLYEQKGDGILKTLYDTIPIATFFMLPLFALLLKLLYWKRGTFAHHIVFSFYFYTFLFTTFCALVLANTFFEIPIWIDVLVFLSCIVYLILALKHFYQSHWLGAIFKANLISLMYLLLVLPLATAGVIFVSFMIY